MSRKTNPRKIPCSQEDVERAEKKARKEAIRFCWGVMLIVLKDKHDAQDEHIRQFWREINDYSQEIAEGRVKLTDILRTLREEYNITL